MDIESLNTFDILAMLDVPPDQVSGYIDISMMVAIRIQRGYMTMDMGSNGLYEISGLFL